MRIKYVDHGLGCYIMSENTIYLNKELRDTPLMYDKVYEHELNHTTGSYKLSDALHDLKPDTSLFWYSLKHPSTWTSFLPFQKYGKHHVINIPNTIIYLLFNLYILLILLKWILK